MRLDREAAALAEAFRLDGDDAAALADTWRLQ